MNENGNEKCSLLLFVARFGFWCVFPFAVRCLLLLFVALSCFEIESTLSQKPKQANAFCCSLWLFVARFGFLWMFPFEHRIARCGFLLVRKTKKSNKRQKMFKWKPGFKAWFPFGLFVPFVARLGFFLPVLVFPALMSVVAFCCSS